MIRILIVEDEEAIANLIRMNLARRDISVRPSLTERKRPTGFWKNGLT